MDEVEAEAELGGWGGAILRMICVAADRSLNKQELSLELDLQVPVLTCDLAPSALCTKHSKIITIMK